MKVIVLALAASCCAQALMGYNQETLDYFKKHKKLPEAMHLFCDPRMKDINCEEKNTQSMIAARDLTNADLTIINFNGANLKGANLTGAYIYTPQAKGSSEKIKLLITKGFLKSHGAIIDNSTIAN